MTSSIGYEKTLLGCLFSSLVVLVACGASEQAGSVSASAGSDTPIPADRQCNFANFHHTEARNSGGPGKCASDCDCDGMRSCVSGECQGTAHPAAMTAAACNDKNYHYNEAWSAGGAGKCSGDCECDGLRTCSSGACSGTAR